MNIKILKKLRIEKDVNKYEYLDVNTNTIIHLDNNIKEVILFGDSHTLCFCGSSFWDKVLLIDNKYLIINRNKDSVSISGLNNENSKTKYNNIIELNFLNQNNNYNLFKLGQVDVEYVYYYKTLIKKENITKIQFYNNIVEKYINFIKKFNGNKIICGINLPSSGSTTNDIIHLKKVLQTNMNIDESMVEHQTKMKDHILFNKILKDSCISNNITYFDLIEESIVYNNDNIELKDEFRDGFGHIHYKGANGCIEKNYLRGSQEYKNKVGIDYINSYHKHTYHTFLKKLCDNL